MSNYLVMVNATKECDVEKFKSTRMYRRFKKDVDDAFASKSAESWSWLTFEFCKRHPLWLKELYDNGIEFSIQKLGRA